MARRPVAAGRRLAGQRHDLDHLLGAEGGGGAGPRRVVEGIGHQLDQPPLVVAPGGGRFQPGDRRQPAGTPGADGGAAEAELASDLVVGEAVAGSQDDVQAADEALGTGLAARQALEDAAEAGTEDNGLGRRATHHSPSAMAAATVGGSGTQLIRNRLAISADVY
jgi:hypothetical protein